MDKGGMEAHLGNGGEILPRGSGKKKRYENVHYISKLTHHEDYS